jgi:D-alanyl-D-alanine carboxypeptidase/D-alanyl-D-alanine-endopeptidase (penicillin-binding protein 4)
MLVAVALLTAAVVVLGQTANGGAPAPSPAPSPATAGAATPTWSSAGPVLQPVTPQAAAPAGDSIARLLDPLLTARALGGQVGATVTDVATGEVVWDRAGARPAPPASNAKILTAAAALASVGPQARFRTRVVQGAGAGEVVLIGGGDPTLTRAGRRSPDDPYARRARIPELARAAAAALRAQGVQDARVRVDDSRFSGPAINPAWERGYVLGGIVLPVSALTLDADAARPAKSQRATDQAIVAGKAFAAALSKQGIAVRGPVTRQHASAGGAVLASADSPALSSIVERMLATSDNDVAEIVARHVAVAQGEAPTFTGAAGAVARVVRALGVDTAGVRLFDGSGLARDDRVAPQTLASVVAVASSPDHPELRPTISGLPVAGFTGTLADRFGARNTRLAAGTVRAKTGTLTGVSSLTGIVYDADGRLLAFSFIAPKVPEGGTPGAEAALDRAAAALAACGCR